MQNKFDKDYFVCSTISNYSDYRKKKFEQQAQDVISVLNLQDHETIFDFGCATGGLIKELKNLGHAHLSGTDISDWAIQYGKDTLKLDNELHKYNPHLLSSGYTHICIFDVLEHLPIKDLNLILELVRGGLKKNLLVRIPVSAVEGEDFFLSVSRNDVTHIQVHSRGWWINKLHDYDLIFVKDINSKSIYSSTGVFSGIFE